MTIKEFFSFRQNKYFWINILAMIAVVVLLMFGTLKGIDIYTHHGEAVVVPDVKGMTVAEAGAVFDSRGLACIVSDSTYVKDKPAGCILDYNPAAGQKVKEGRIIYLTINAINIPLQVVPDVADNSSLRQAEARILASGFKLNDIQYVPGEKDWVYGVKYRERMLAIGDKVPMGATLTLMVGDGNYQFMNQETFDQIPIAHDLINGVDFLLEGMVVDVVSDASTETVLYADVPVKVQMKITYTEPGLKGDTATNTLKPATVESGATVRVPLFINEGETIEIDTRDGSYVSRVKA